MHLCVGVFLFYSKEECQVSPGRFEIVITREIGVLDRITLIRYDKGYIDL